jgi:hypothetical protein
MRAALKHNAVENRTQITKLSAACRARPWLQCYSFVLKEKGYAMQPISAKVLALAALLYSGVAASETVVVDDQVMVRESSIERPSAGMTMKAVETHFGAPATRHEAVGQPPITRWDYAAFTVFFEKDRVIHAVVNPS